MPNIKFSYLYRDGANYKKYGDVVFANPTNVNLSKLETIILSKLIYGEWFYADEWKLAELFLKHCDFRIAPTWHEFERIECVDEPADKSYYVEDFVKIIEKTDWKF